jgi:hypothetical protein
VKGLELYLSIYFFPFRTGLAVKPRLAFTGVHRQEAKLYKG